MKRKWIALMFAVYATITPWIIDNPWGWLISGCCLYVMMTVLWEDHE